VAAVQIAKGESESESKHDAALTSGLGCKVIGTASTDTKRGIATRAGADYVIDYTKEGWQKEVLELTGNRGVDVVYDPVGLLVPSLKCVAWNARLLVVGFAGGTIEKVPANLVLLKNVAILGVRGGETSGEQRVSEILG
jgi:NADPH2:quinone reductase